MEQANNYKIDKNPVLRGHTKFGDIFMENTHEPVLSDDDYHKVINAIENKTHKSKSKHNAIFRGVLKCPQCNGNLHLYAGTIHPKTVNLIMSDVILVTSAIVINIPEIYLLTKVK